MLKDLPDKYQVFYSMHWQGYQKQNGVNEDEADFIIAHPDLGVLILEVKGGGIQYDAENGQWYSQSRDGETHKIKDPIVQGRRNHYEIRNKLEQLPGWPQRKFNIWHAICFPDVYLKSGQSFKPDLPREIIIDANDLNDIASTIKRVFIHCFGENIKDGAPGLDRMQIIEGLLTNSFEFLSPLGMELEIEDRQLIKPTEQQYIALSLLGERKRVAIAGCAGSGKTMLATRKAQQFSDLGMSVLLLCFNKALSEDLRKKLPDTIEVYTFHDICRVALKQAGFTLQYTKEMGDLYDVVLPNALLGVTDEIGPVYDVIIVDEGQDFKENYWIALYPLLKEEGYLFNYSNKPISRSKVQDPGNQCL